MGTALMSWNMRLYTGDKDVMVLWYYIRFNVLRAALNIQIESECCTEGHTHAQDIGRRDLCYREISSCSLIRHGKRLHYCTSVVFPTTKTGDFGSSEVVKLKTFRRAIILLHNSKIFMDRSTVQPSTARFTNVAQL